jgi:hypothetical protein
MLNANKNVRYYGGGGCSCVDGLPLPAAVVRVVSRLSAGWRLRMLCHLMLCVVALVSVFKSWVRVGGAILCVMCCMTLSGCASWVDEYLPETVLCDNPMVAQVITVRQLAEFVVSDDIDALGAELDHDGGGKDDKIEVYGDAVDVVSAGVLILGALGWTATSVSGRAELCSALSGCPVACDRGEVVSVLLRKIRAESEAAIRRSLGIPIDVTRPMSPMDKICVFRSGFVVLTIASDSVCYFSEVIDRARLPGPGGRQIVTVFLKTMKGLELSALLERWRNIALSADGESGDVYSPAVRAFRGGRDGEDVRVLLDVGTEAGMTCLLKDIESLQVMGYSVRGVVP